MSDQVLEAGTTAVVGRCEARGQLHDEQAELLIADINSVAIKVMIESINQSIKRIINCCYGILIS